jgi:3D (Asp-Asp-Asp) domain-containing protein
LPRYETPIARAPIQHVRTTAYTDTESDHLAYTNHNALGGVLQCNAIHSAAADWSRWPAGTIFRIRETGELYRVDDYGWALAGTNTIDLYKPSRAAMDGWGVRHVTIENLQWGDPNASLAVLRQRSHYRHVQRMIQEMEERQDELAQPGPTVGSSPEPMVAMMPAPDTASASVTVAASGTQSVPRAIPATGGYHPAAIAHDPFFANGTR